MSPLHKKMLLAKWRNLGVLFDFEVEEQAMYGGYWVARFQDAPTRNSDPPGRWVHRMEFKLDADVKLVLNSIAIRKTPEEIH